MADFPNIEPDLEEIALIANNQTYDSILTGEFQSAGLSGAKWQCTPTFSNRNGKEARDLRAFIFNQEGVAGRFNYYPASIDNLGTHAGLGVVDGAGQVGKSLVTKGWDADQELLFASGDYLTVNGEMKMVTSDVSVGQDYIEYDAVNYIPSPFDPSVWSDDPDISYSNVTEENPSGQNYVGQFEYLGPGFAGINGSFNNSATMGDVFYCCIIVKSDTPDMGLRIYFNLDGVRLNDTYVNANNGSNSLADGIKVDQLTNGYFLFQVSINIPSDSTDLDCYIQARKVDQNGVSQGQPDAGDKIKCQAAFFGKADDWPAKLRANATIPITPALRVSPSDENAIEVNNPYFPARLETDDQSRLQVSSPVIYNTSLSIVEDF